MLNTDSDILCLSWCDADNVINYGQILQGCSMMYLLRKNSESNIYYLSYSWRGIRGKIRYYCDHFNIFSGHLRAYLKTRRMMKWFIDTNRISFHQIANEKQVEKFAKKSDFYICGSDQIWHPQNYDKTYFLDFGLESAKRISYAASLPKSRIEEQYKKQINNISNHLKKIDKISVREQSSVELIKELSNKSVEHVIDPTYLVPTSIWNKLTESVKVTGKYLFVYIPNGMNEKMIEQINLIKEKTQIEDVYILMTRGENHFNIGKVLKFLSVGEFLYMIQNAECVYTSSFHAVVFSTIFHREFFCYDVPNKERGEDNRLIDLLNLINQPDRLLNNCNQINAEIINYSEVDQLINYQRAKSKKYLNQVLKND